VVFFRAYVDDFGISPDFYHLLSYRMEQSPSWEANQSLQLVKKFPAFLWNPKA
jgi:hypothetical protein